MKITITNSLNKPIRNMTIHIFDPSTLFEDKTTVLKKKRVEDNDKKDFIFPLKPAKYILQITEKKSAYGQIIDGKKDVKVKLPLFFSSFKKDLTLSKNEIDRLNEDTRWDLHKCYKCKKQYRDIVDRHKCTYCGKYFGETHRLPEDHDCKGNPTLPRDMKRGAGGKRPLGENSLNNI